MASDPKVSKRRGRPISDLVQGDESLKARRERNREAQNTFRKRRQAAEEAQAHRLRRLEDVVEEMSSVFVAFVDDMLQTDAIKQHAGLLASLKDTMAHVLALANEVVGPEEESLGCEDSLCKVQRVKRMRAEETTPAVDVHAGNGAYAYPSQPQPATADWATPPFCTPLSDSVSVLRQTSPSRVTQYTYLSSMTLPPCLGSFEWANEPAAIILAPDSFAARLVHASIATGYLVLSRASVGDERRMFGSTLRFRTREHLLMKMRWLLGPGRHELYRAADLPSGRYGDEDFTGEELCPDLDQLRHTRWDDPTLPRFLSVLGIEKQLMALGARIVDAETLELNIAGPSMPPETPAGPTPAPAPAPQQPDSWSFVDFFAGDRLRPRGSTLTMQLSMSLLVFNLSQRSVCLTAGPGFPREDLGRAIEASIVTVTGGDDA